MPITIPLRDAYAGAVRSVAAETLGMDGGSREALTLRVPRGTREGERLPLTTSDGAIAGAAEVRFEPDSLFRAEGLDVHLELPVAPWEVALGVTLRVPTLGGAVDLRVPAGSQDGEILRLARCGLPGAPPGDQFVRLRVVVPRAASARARSLYGDLRRELHFNPRAELYRRAGLAG